MHEPAGAPHGARVIEPGKLRSVKTYLSPTDETLWAQLQAAQDTIDALQAVYHPLPRPGSGNRAPDCVDPEACALLKTCADDLVLARDCIERRDHWWRAFLENIQLFWRLVHHIDEDLVLLIPVASLAARAVEVQGIVERRLYPRQQKDWLGADGESGPLKEAVRVISERAKAPSAAMPSPYRELQAQRDVVRRALRAANERSDRHFRQLAFNAFIRVVSAVIVILIIVAGGIISYHTHSPQNPSHLATQALLLLVGAMGALTSNMLTSSLLLAATGPNRRFILYNVLMRPVLGAIAAYVFVFLALSGLLFQIAPSFPPDPPRPTAVTAKVGAPAAPPATPGAVAETSNRQALITINLPDQRAVSAAFFVFAFAFGFSAERILAKTLDQALQRLSTTAQRAAPAGRLEDQTAT